MSLKLSALVAGLVLLVAGPALARPRPLPPQQPAAAPTYAPQAYPRGRADVYATPPGHSGTIHWNTGDANGNLGIPPSGDGGGGR